MEFYCEKEKAAFEAGVKYGIEKVLNNLKISLPHLTNDEIKLLALINESSNEEGK